MGPEVNLERRVIERTAQLEVALKEIDSFFLAGAGSSILAVSFKTHLISWRLSQARFRDALDFLTSSRSF